MAKSIYIFKWQSDNPALLQSAVDVSQTSVFTQGFLREMLTFNSRLIASRTPPGTKVSVQLRIAQTELLAHALTTTDHLSAVLISSVEYP